MKLTIWHRTALRLATEYPVDLRELSEPMRQKFIDLGMHEPPLVEADGDFVSATDAGRSAIVEDK